MASTNQSNSEHAFVPGDDTMTVVFASPTEARRAISALSELGVGPDEVQIITGGDHHVANTNSPGFKPDSPGIEGLQEIAHVLTESFSDDDKAYVEFDRVLSAGGALLSLSINGNRDRRSEVASFLRSRGARAVYYWGALATEQL